MPSWFSAAVATGCLLGTLLTTHAAEHGRPNVVLIISDDQSWSDYGFMKHDVIRTPHLDRLARQSALFTRGYVPTSLCRPSLATIITGLYPHQHKITGNDPALLRNAQGQPDRSSPAYQALRQKLISHIDDLPTLPRLLAGQQYRSHQSGKWWEGHFTRGGFTHGMTHGDPSRRGRHGDQGLTIGRQGLKPVLDFIDASGEQPFFVWYAPFLPHTPHNPPARLLNKYKQADRPLPLARYYAMCEWFDETCGTLLEHLDRKGLSDNTLVVYVTDNGWIQRTKDTKTPAGWRTGFAPRSKQSPNEGGVRTPIMLRWPGRIKPQDFPTLASSIDLAPTILAACGLPPHPSMSGINLLDVCDGKPTPRNTIFGEVFAHDIVDIDNPSRSALYRWCVQGRWKLILTDNGKVGRYRVVHPRTNRNPQLYDLLADPHETQDLAAQHPQRTQSLSRALNGWWRPTD